MRSRALFPVDTESADDKWDDDELATVANPSVEVLIDMDRAKELVLSLGLVTETAWTAAVSSLRGTQSVSNVLRQLSSTPTEDDAGAQSSLLTDFQVRQILAGYGERLRLGDCIVSNQAGASAYGENFFGRKVKPPRLVLVQTFFPPVACDPGQFAATVVRHARELTSLHHPMLPIILEIGDAHGFAYVAIERRQGLSLWSFVKRSVRKRRTVPLTQILTVIARVADALDHLHTRKWCHGEICPDTILLGKTGDVWLQSGGLLDLAFECFAAMSPGDESPEYRQWWAWNAAYGAPEVRDGQIKPTPAVDTYSLGAVLYFLLCGRPLSKEQAKYYKSADWHLTNPSEAPPDTVSRLERLLEAMLAAKPSARPVAADVAEIANQLISEMTIPETMAGASEPIPSTSDMDLRRLVAEAVQKPDSPKAEPFDASHTARELPVDATSRIPQENEATDRSSKTKAPTQLSKPSAASGTVVEALPLKPALSGRTSLEVSPKPTSKSASEWFEEGCRLLEQGEALRAADLFDRAVTEDESFWQAWYNRGLAQRRLWRMEEAAESFRRVTAFVPKNSRPWFQLGVALVSLGDYSEALEAFDLAHWLGHPHAQAALVRCREEAVKTAGQDAELRSKARRHASMARAEAQQARFDKAHELYAQSLEFDPSNFRVWYDQGVVCTSLQRMPEAIECFSEALRLNPEYRKAWYNKAVALVKLRSFGDALPCFEEAVRLGHPLAEQAMQACRRKVGPREKKIVSTPQQSKPREKLQPVAFAEPDQNGRELLAEATAADAPEAQYLRKGNQLMSNQLIREAINCLDHALAHNPYYWEAWFAKARAWLKLGETQFASHCLNRVLKLNTNCASAWYEQGRILLEQNRRLEAHDHFQRAHAAGHPAAMSALNTLEEYEALSSHT